MNIHNLTANQFKRAAAIKEQLGSLIKELRNILGDASNSGPGPKTNRTMSASAKRKIAVAQRARWAKLRRAKSSATFSRTCNKEENDEPRSQGEVVGQDEALWAAKKTGKK